MCLCVVHLNILQSMCLGSHLPAWLFGNLFESLATKWLLDMSIDWQLTFELWHHFRWWSLILFY